MKKSTRKPGKTVSTVIPPEAVDSIQAVSKNQGKTISGWIAELIDDYLNGRIIRRDKPALNVMRFSCGTLIRLDSIQAIRPTDNKTTEILLFNSGSIELQQPMETTERDLLMAGVVVR